MHGKNILMATILDLGTCWRGSKFDSARCSEKLGTADNELLPAIVTIGYPRLSFKAILLRGYKLLTKNRKPWEELFSHGNMQTPLTREIAEKYAVPIESLRLGPSASNLQPWRIIKEKDEDAYHFYLKRTEVYPNKAKEIRLQNVDMGIALCHFELSANELGIKGVWKDEEPDLQADDMEYVVSWIHGI